ncbi:MAG: Rpn family recombination-promoting nuclease/putative transposase [Paludibacteraceae bacterium]|nr:Rpn family recombination-promoting nuclease/putative transposase [Paludibacteraceae bacterium]
MAKYIDLRCDFGFKYCMNDEVIMKSFLNAILDGDFDKITSVKFENVEMPRPNKRQRGVTFDLHCTTQMGDTILIEMQNSSQKFFKTRANYYIQSLIQKHISRGLKWEKMKSDIPRVIGIFIMGEKMEELETVITRTGECDLDTGKEFWDRQRKYFVSLPKFQWDRNNNSLKNLWIETFKNLGNMENIDPSVYERADEGLLRLIEKAKVAALTDEEFYQYESSMKRLEDEIDMEEHGYMRGVEDGIKQGIEQGIIQGRAEGETKVQQIVANLRQVGFSNEKIAEITKIPLENIVKL